LWFAAQGHRVLPLFGVTDGRCDCGSSGCVSPGKHPIGSLVPRGLIDATTGAATIRSWFERHPDANYGVVCDELLIIDADIKNGGTQKWYDHCSQPTHHLPPTWSVRTGSGGTHTFFERVPGIGNGKLDTGIDIKSKGGYIVGPGSGHVSGGYYHWLPQSGPAEAPLAAAPVWLVSLIKTRTHCGKVIPISEWRRKARERLVDGARHTEVLKLIGHLVSHGADEEVTRDLVLSFNCDKCDPPLPDADVLGMLTRICIADRQRNAWLLNPEGAANG
jgi:hypothetical protein